MKGTSVLSWRSFGIFLQWKICILSPFGRVTKVPKTYLNKRFIKWDNGSYIRGLSAPGLDDLARIERLKYLVSPMVICFMKLLQASMQLGWSSLQQLSFKSNILGFQIQNLPSCHLPFHSLWLWVLADCQVNERCLMLMEMKMLRCINSVISQDDVRSKTCERSIFDGMGMLFAEQRNTFARLV